MPLHPPPSPTSPSPSFLSPSALLAAVFLSLLALSSASFSPTSLAFSECVTCLTWSKITGSTPWSPRVGATLYLHPYPLRYANSSHPNELITFPPNSLLFFGGDHPPDAPHNDVWLSSDRGAHWHLVVGNASTGNASNEAAPFPYSRTSFEPYLSSTVALRYLPPPLSSNSTLPPYHNESLLIAKIGGQFLNPQAQELQDALWVWTTRDLFAWHQLSFAENPAHYIKAAAVIDSAGVVYLMGGQLPDPYTPRVSAEVWRSDDDGFRWTCVTAAAPWGPRSSHAAVVLSGAQSPALGGADVIYLVGGTDGGQLYNGQWMTPHTALPHHRCAFTHPPLLFSVQMCGRRQMGVRRG